MGHEEYKRIIAGADKAVLFIHGIVGTPRHFDNFIPLIPQEWSVYNVPLDGHGKGVKDFSKTSMEKWKKQIDYAVNELAANHGRIIIAAHSMGTLFALQQAVRKPDKIDVLFLLATPLRLRIKPRMLLNSAKVFFDRIKPDDKVALVAKNMYGIEVDRRFWLYFGWIPRYLELFEEIRKTRKIVSDLHTRCLVYQSKEDEMVSLLSCSLFEDVQCVTLTVLENSAHYYYSENDLKFLTEEFDRLMNA